MDWMLEIKMLAQIFLSAILGCMIGLERQLFGREAGIRTHAAVCLGSAIFSILSLQFMESSDPTRIAAQVTSGIGFLGAGIILRDMGKGKTRGLTTAASLWVTAAIGMAVAFEYYFFALGSSFLMILVLSIRYLPIWSKKSASAEAEAEDEDED